MFHWTMSTQELAWALLRWRSLNPFKFRLYLGHWLNFDQNVTFSLMSFVALDISLLLSKILNQFKYKFLCFITFFFLFIFSWISCHYYSLLIISEQKYFKFVFKNLAHWFFLNKGKDPPILRMSFSHSPVKTTKSRFYCPCTYKIF